MQELRHAWRSLRRSPLLCAVVVSSLALGIGANTALFSLVDGLLVRPLPVREPERLTLLSSGDVTYFTYRVWEAIQDGGTFESAFAWTPMRVDLASQGQSDFVDALWASGGFFGVLGVQPTIGRAFTEADDRADGGVHGPVAVLGHDFWQHRYGADPAVIGRTLTVEGMAFTIVGVAPSGFFGPNVGSSFDIALPLATEPLAHGEQSRVRFGEWIYVMGRLRPGQTAEAATAALRVAQPGIRRSTLPQFDDAKDGDHFLGQPFTAWPAPTGNSFVRRRYGPSLVTLAAVAALILLLACANLAQVLMARAEAHRHELGVRLALGASRSRLARGLLLEALILSLAGSAAGLMLARWTAPLLVHQLSLPSYRIYLELPLDQRVLGMTVALALATTVLFGTLPALRVAAVGPFEAVTLKGRSIVSSRRGTEGVLVTVQVALSLVLVVAAGQLIRTFRATAAIPLGFDPDRVLEATVDLARTARSAHDRPALHERLRAAAADVPGVESAATSIATPLGGRAWTTEVAEETGAPQRVYLNRISPKWFGTLRTQVRAGREFEAHDDPGSPAVAVVNEAFVHGVLGGRPAVGRALWRVDGARRTPMLVVGVVEDAVYPTVRGTPPATLYVPVGQSDAQLPPFVKVLVRSSTSQSGALEASLGPALNAVVPESRVAFRSLGTQVDSSFIRERLAATVSGFFGILALLLAGLGVYGTAASAVTRRRGEIAVRMAVGATAASVVRLVVSRAAAPMALGIAVGLGLSLWTGHLMRSLLHGVRPADVLTLATAVGVLTVVGVLALWLPARRAAAVDPAVVLKEA